MPAGDAIGPWLTALIRASSELLDGYLARGRAIRTPGAGTPHRVASRLIGSTPGEVRCSVDPPLAEAVAEAMWGQPAPTLQPHQIDDAVRELCGHIIGHAAGEIAARFPGVLFEPPHTLPAAEESAGPPADQAVVPTPLGSLRWAVTAASAATGGQQLALAVRDRIRSLRESELPIFHATRVLRIEEDAPDAFNQLLDIVEGDPSLSARIIRRVNAASARRAGGRVTSLRQALLHLGLQAAKGLVVSALLSRATAETNQEAWQVVRHCRYVALLCRELGAALGLDRDECYLQGLLHDLGRLVLCRLYPGQRATELAGDEAELLLWEARTMGITHCDAGAILAAAWRLPEGVSLAMAAHHDLTIIDQIGLLPKQLLEIKMVAAAEQMTQEFRRGNLGQMEAQMEGQMEDGCDKAASLLGMDVGLIRQCLCRAAEQWEEELLDAPA
ncbi:MAG: HDOD domain-containing protein [Myxococcales bacterium]|nr:HDOD domain-containing protein [Myxococcota bacterium]MDW8280532.1 HDOD domain-containing protein [Myxococcales bacterium]